MVLDLSRKRGQDLCRKDFADASVRGIEAFVFLEYNAEKANSESK